MKRSGIGLLVLAAILAVACSGGSGDDGKDSGGMDPGAPTDIGGKDTGGSDTVISNPKVAVNEIVHQTDVKKSGDWVELYNPGTEDVDLSGWMLKDDNDAHVFTFTSGKKIGAGQFLLVYGPGTTAPLVFDFGLGDSDAARLFTASGTLVDIAQWVKGEGKAGASFGRYPDGSGSYATLPTPTPGAKNVAPD